MDFGYYYLAEYLNIVICAGMAATIFLGGWAPFVIPGLDGFNHVMGLIPGVVWFVAKVFFVVGLLLWERWTFPPLACRSNPASRVEIPHSHFDGAARRHGCAHQLRSYQVNLPQTNAIYGKSELFFRTCRRYQDSGHGLKNHDARVLDTENHGTLSRKPQRAQNVRAFFAVSSFCLTTNSTNISV